VQRQTAFKLLRHLFATTYKYSTETQPLINRISTGKGKHFSVLADTQ